MAATRNEGRSCHGCAIIFRVDTFPKQLVVRDEDAGKRLDQFLVGVIADTSRARLQQLIHERQVLVNDDAAKASLRGLKCFRTRRSGKRPPAVMSWWNREAY